MTANYNSYGLELSRMIGVSQQAINKQLEILEKLLKYGEIHYIFEGDMDPESVKKAIDLSLEKYCSVSLTVKG